MRVFGCLVYAHDNKNGRDKFGERGRPRVFVGHPNAQKGYRIYDIEKKNIHVSRDVTFMEEIFPFKQKMTEIDAQFSVNSREQEWHFDDYENALPLHDSGGITTAC